MTIRRSQIQSRIKRVRRRRAIARESDRKLQVERLEDRRLLAVGPQLVGIQPNDGELLSPGQVRNTEPKDLVFFFNSVADIDPATLPDAFNPTRTDSVQILRSGLDGTFEVASVSSDFNTLGQVVIEFTALQAGQGGTFTSLEITKSDQGTGDRAPTITVTGKTIQVDLNEELGSETRAQDLVNAINADPDASALLTARIKRGAAATNIAEPEITYSPLQLAGANAAKASTNFNADPLLEVLFTATQPGVDGNGIRVFVEKADLGDTAGPLVEVTGPKEVTLTLNTNVDMRTTARELVDAVNAHPGASRIVTASLPAGDPDTIIAGPAITFSPLVLGGANDIRIFPGHVGLGESPREVVMRFKEHLDDDVYLINIFGSGPAPLANEDGEAFNDGEDFELQFELDLGAQIVAVVPQPIVRDPQTQALSQQRDSVVVYFNDDDLDPVTAQDPRFYQLIYVNETVENTDDVVFRPESVTYDAATDMAVLTFERELERLRDPATGIPVGPGTFRLRIGTDEAAPLPPQRLNVGADPGSSFDTAHDLTNQWDSGQVINVFRTGDAFTEGQTLTVVDDTGTSQVFEFDSGFTLRLPLIGAGPGGIVDGDIFTIGDGNTTVQFEFDRLGGVDPATDVTINFVNGESAASLTAKVVTAVAGAGIGLNPTNLGAGSVHLGGTTTHTVDTSASALTADGQPGAQLAGAVPVPFVPDGSFTPNQMAVALANAVNNVANFNAAAAVAGNQVRLQGDIDTSISGDVIGLTLASEGIILSSSIDVQPFLLDLPGASDEPGHRDIRVQQHLQVRRPEFEVPGPAVDNVQGITRIFYNFQDEYGFDPQGNILNNAITETEKRRAREVFSMYGQYIGVEFVESDNLGITVASGDMRAIDPSVPTGPGELLGLADRVLQLVVLDLQDFSNPGDDAFGGKWFREAMRQVGHVLGLGNTDELPPLTLQGDDDSLLPGVAEEPIFPGDHDIVHARHLYRPESKDIDLFQFELVETGLFTAETIAERQPDASALDTALSLYRAQLDDTGRVVRRELIARNDDYFSNDSYIELLLSPGQYFIGVSASGNNEYNPAIEDTGFGGTSQGEYDLRLNFRPDADRTIVDATGVALDGDADGIGGGVYNTWFRAAAPQGAAGQILGDPRTLIVDKSNVGGGTGSLANPFPNIRQALQAARPDDIVRIVGNPGADNDITTLHDNLAYEIGFSRVGGVELADGTTLEVPQGVTVVIDSGAIVKLRRARIGVGSSTPQVDRSAGALQVLGTPRVVRNGSVVLAETGLPEVGSVFFTSVHNDAVGIDTNPDLTHPDPQPGDWGGLSYRNDLDLADANRFVYENEGIFLGVVNHADITYGGGTVNIAGITQVVTPINLTNARPALSYNSISLSADAAISANPDSSLETNFHSPRFQGANFTSDYTRIGPDIHHNMAVENSINGYFIRIATPAGDALQPLNVPGRWDDTDITHVVSENLLVRGTPGGRILESQTPPVDLVELTALAGGTLLPGTYNYRVVFVDADGNEGPPSEPTRDVTLGVGQGTVRLDNLPTLRNNFGQQFVARRIYRSTPAGAGPYTLVEEINDVDTRFVDDGTTRGGQLSQFVEEFRPRLDARLAVDPGTIVKLDRSRIDTQFDSEFIAEGTAASEIIFTSLQDTRYGNSGTFDTNSQQGTRQAAPGDWAGLFFGHLSNVHIADAVLAYAGGITRIEGSFSGFNPIEIHQANARIVSTQFENNANGEGGQAPIDRFGRGFNQEATIFVRGAQPVILDNTFLDNQGPAINVNLNALNSVIVNDLGRATGRAQVVPGFNDNQGPLIRLNRIGQSFRTQDQVLNIINGMVVRGGAATTQVVMDDTDIVHVVFDSIDVPNFHTFGGVRLESSPSESLVVKLSGPSAGFTAGGEQLDIDDRIGGSLQIVGQPRFPVVLTGFKDDTVGAGFAPDGTPQNDTNGDGDRQGLLPTGPEVDNGILIDDDVFPISTPGFFSFKALDGGASGFAHTAGGQNGGGGGISAQGKTTAFVDRDVIFEFFNFLDVGSNGSAIELSTGNGSTVTMPATLISDDLVVSEGTIQGQNGTVNWRVESRFDDGIAKVFNTLILSSPMPLGNLQFINYLDEDIVGVSDDILVPRGTPGEEDFRAFTLDNPERIGFSQGGFYLDGPELVNATYDGWAADEFRDLLTAIETTGTNYTIPGNIDTNSLPPQFDQELGQTIFGPEDITSAFAWSVDPTATSARMTSFLELVARPPSNQPGEWRSVRVNEFANDRNVDVATEREARDIVGGPDSNQDPDNAQFVGALAPNLKAGDDNLRLGFEVHGVLAKPGDVDVYSFEAKAGTEVWFDIDRTTHSLDTVVELIDSTGAILAQSDNSYQEEIGEIALFVNEDKVQENHVNPLRRSPSDFYPESAFDQPKDQWSTNPRDAGMRVVLPGSLGTTNTYHVRVRSSNLKPGEDRSALQDPDRLDEGLTSGVYQLQIRLQEQDEIPGTTVQYSDIRFATNGIEVFGQPTHSALTGEAIEDDSNNDTIASAQQIGNYLVTDRATLAVGGDLSVVDDVDFFQFDVTYDDVESIPANPAFPAFNNPIRHAETIFDIDYADGLGRPNTRLSIFDENGNLVLIGTDSNIAEDLPAPLEGADMDDLSRGSAGPLDPYVGTVELPEGTYSVAVTSDALIPAELEQYSVEFPANPLFRLEPVNSVIRVADDRIEGPGGLTAEAEEIPVLFDPQSSIVPHHLGDVVLFVSSDIPGLDNHRIYTVDGFTGEVETEIGDINFDIGDIAMRDDGRLFAYSLDMDRFPSTDADTGHYIEIDTGDGTATDLGDDGVQTFEEDVPMNPGQSRRSNLVNGQRVGYGIQYQAMAFGHPLHFPNGTNLFTVGSRPPGHFSPGIGYDMNILYQANPVTGVPFSAPANNRAGNALFQGAGTQIVERGFLDTDADPFNTANTVIIATEATEVDPVTGLTTFLIQDKTAFSVDHDGDPATPPRRFEFNSGPEVLIHPDPANGRFIRDGDIFTLDGIPFEFDTGSVIVVDAASGVGVFDGETITVTNNANPEVARTFEIEKFGGVQPGNVPIFINNSMTQGQLVDAIVIAINGDALFGVTAERLQQLGSNRITLRNESPTQVAVSSAANISIEGRPGGQGGPLIRGVEETSDRDELGAAIRASIVNVSGITAGVDGERVNFSGANRGDFFRIVNRGVMTDVPTSDGLVTAGSIGIPFLAHDTAEDIARRIETSLAINGIAANQIRQVVQLQSPATFTAALPPLQIGGASPGGEITGITFVGSRMFAVSDAGGFYEVFNYFAPLGATLDYIETSGADLQGISFSGLSTGPLFTENGVYEQILFGIEDDGTIHAFNTAGVLQPIFVDGNTSIETNLPNITGITFSTLATTNEWHVTGSAHVDNLHEDRGGEGRPLDPGHGINPSFDLSRGLLEGNNSIHFGRENPAAQPPNALPYEGTYFSPGGAHGSVESNPFSLAGADAADKPVLYFTYFAETENRTSEPGIGPMQDSFRIFITDSSGEWDLLATNNIFPPDELSLGPNNVQPIFDNTGTWRQVRAPLDNYAGRDNLRLRFDFATAGTMNTGSATEFHIFTTGEELRLIAASNLRDGDTFTIDSDGLLTTAGVDTFEVDLGFTLVAPTGANIQDGEVFTVRDAFNVEQFEFDQGDGVGAGNFPVPFGPGLTAEEVAQNISAAIATALGAPTFQDDLTAAEPNDSLFFATNSGLIGTDGRYEATGFIGDNPNVDPDLDVDLIEVDLRIGSTLTADILAAQDTPASTLDAVLRVFDRNGVEVAINDNANGLDPFVSFTAPLAGTYYVGVSGAPNTTYAPTLEGSGLRSSTGGYKLDITVSDPAGAAQLQGNRINLPTAVDVINGGTALIVDGAVGVSAGNVPVLVNAQMSATDVKAVVRQALADTYANGNLNAIKDYNDVIRLIGHFSPNPGPFGLTSSLPGDEFGAFDENIRGQQNQFEGIYFDDIVIGYTERGEMGTGATGQAAFVPNPALPANQILVGDYQLEIRRGEPVGQSWPSPLSPFTGQTQLEFLRGQPDPGFLQLTRAIDTNDRLSEGKSLLAPPAWDIADGQIFTLGDGLDQVTFEFEDVNVGNGVAPGNVLVPFDPSQPLGPTDHTPESAAEVAAAIRDAINSPQAQAVLEIQAGLDDGTTRGRSATTNRINLYGNAEINLILPTVQVTETTDDGNALRDALLGGNFTPVGDATYVGGPNAAGFFDGGLSSIGIEKGVVLTTGDARFAEGPNTFDFSSGISSGLGDADLDQIFSPFQTSDATTLEFQIQLNQPQDLFLEFVFASEEYNEFVNFGGYNQDVFAILVDDENLALIPGTQTEVTINTVNDTTNPQLFNNNDPTDNGQFLDRFGYDGFTSVFTASKLGLAAGTHDVKIAIADVANLFFDSGVFLRAFNDAGSSLRSRLPGETFVDNGDQNTEREQGQVLIHSNRVSNSLEFGIVVDAGQRTGPEGNPHAGPARVTREVNDLNLVTGVTVTNNLVATNGRGGIRFSGDPNAASLQVAPVPFGRIINNTVVGTRSSDRGIVVDENASPTLINNIVADTTVGIDIDTTSETTVLGATLYAGNLNNVSNGTVGLGEFPITVASSDDLFVNKDEGNFYLKAGAAAIDSSLDSLQDRPAMVTLRDPLGFSRSPILAPDLDITGQRRVDDPSVASDSGLGNNVFKDRGALDRADFAGPSAVLVTPRDNDAAGVDKDDRETFVDLTRAILGEFAVQLVDGIQPSNQSSGTGADDLTVVPETVLVSRDGTLLEEGVDYLFSYNNTSDVILLTPLAGIWEPDHVYEIELLNEDVFLIDAGDGGRISDEETFDIEDADGRVVTFEFDTGYTIQVPVDGGSVFSDGDIFNVTINNNPFNFEFDNNGSVLPSNTQIPFDITDDQETLADSIAAAVAGSGVGLPAVHLGGGFIHLGGTPNHVLDVTGTALTQDGLPGVTAPNEEVDIIPHISFDADQVAQAIADAVNDSPLVGVTAQVRLGKVVLEGAVNLTGVQNDFVQSIKDIAGNNLQPNRFTGETAFTIFIGSGLDYGDAPDPTFPTLKASDGARHEIVEDFQLGIDVDADVDGNPTIGADGDGDDDDGVFFVTPLTSAYEATITVTATGITPIQPGLLDAWIDFNGDGTFGANEQIFQSEPLVDGDNNLTFTVAGNATLDPTYARFRLSSAGGLQPFGPAADGEVEDYLVTINPNPWQNPDDPLDVNNDGFRSPIDALLVINFLNLNPNFGRLPAPPVPPFVPPPFLDVNGDSFASPIDALLVINFLNNPGAPGQGEGEAGPDRSLLQSSSSRQFVQLDDFLSASPVTAPTSASSTSGLAQASDGDTVPDVPVGLDEDDDERSRLLDAIATEEDWEELLEDLAGDLDDANPMDVHGDFFSKIRFS